MAVKTLGSLMQGRRPQLDPQEPFETDNSSGSLFYNFKTLSPRRLKRIVDRADNYGRVDLLYKLYDDMLIIDTHYAGLINQLKSTLAGMPLRVMPAEGRTEREARLAEEYADYVNEVIRLLDTHSLVKEFVEPYIRGAALYKLSWALDDLPYGRQMYFPDMIEPVDGRHLRMEMSPNKDSYGEIKVLLENNREGVPLSEFDFSNHLFIEDGIGTERYSRMGVARKVLPWFVAIKYVNSWWVQFIENYGAPMRVGKYPRNTSRSKRKKMQTFLKSLGQNGYGLFPHGMEVQLIESNKGGSITTYQDFVRKGNSEQSKLILGESSTTSDSRNGSYARTVVMNGIRMDIMQNVAAISSKGFEGIAEKGLRLNYGGEFERHLMPKIKPILLNSQNAKEHAQAAEIAQSSGIPVPDSFWYEKTLGVERPQRGQRAVVHGQLYTVGEDPMPERQSDSESTQSADNRNDERVDGETSVANSGQ